MRVLLLVSAYWATVIAAFVPFYVLEEAEKYFEDFITKYDKKYAGEEEKAARFEIFKANLKEFNRLNAEDDYATFGINEFTDLSTEEFTKMHMGLRTTNDGRAKCHLLTDESILDVDVPESFDWRTKGVVTPVKNQSTCGSCYAFSVIGVIESQYAIKTGEIVDLSEQQIVDCDTLDLGCGGGLASNALSELIRMGGSMYEADYPYANEDQQCKFDPTKVAVHVEKCYTYYLRSQKKLKQLLYQTGPISISFQATALHGYHGGIVKDSKCVGSINHAVLLVGYGTDKKKNMPYWIVKISWGAQWGEAGYFRLQRSNNPDGACMMLNDDMAAAVIG